MRLDWNKSQFVFFTQKYWRNVGHWNELEEELARRDGRDIGNERQCC
jgi:hypothetical protein